VTDSTGWLQAVVTHVASNGSWTNGDTMFISFARSGNIGVTGSTGAAGPSAGLDMEYDSTTADADQGAGKISFNNGTLSSASIMYVDDVDSNAASINSFVDSWDDSTTTALRGTVTVTKQSDAAVFAIYNVTGAVTSATTYSKIPVSYITGAGSLTNEDAVQVNFTRTGNTGSAGSSTPADNVFRIQDNGDNTKQIAFEASGIGSGVTRTITMPNSDVTLGTPNSNTVDSDHYVDGSIDNAHIADDAIDSEHYVDGSIDNAHIADDAIDSEHYVAGSIDEAHIANDAINFATHLKAGTDGQIISWDASGDPVAVGPGSDGEVLTSTGAGSPPAFEAVAAGGIWTSITTTSISNLATVNFTGLVSGGGTYVDYKFILRSIVSATNDQTLRMLFSDDEGSSYETGSYHWMHNKLNQHASSPSTTLLGAENSSFIQLTDEVGNVAAEDGVSIELYIADPHNTSVNTYCWWHGSMNCDDGTKKGLIGQGGRYAIVDHDAIRFQMASGNITSGEIELLGLAT